MPKALAILGMVVAALLVLLFGLDLGLKIPFDRADTMMDCIYVVCGLILGYLSFSTFRQQA